MPGRPSPSIQRTQGGVTVGVNLGIAEVGISTDYGGAGKIGFGGQSITWGLEGGKIQMGIAGFELIIEARNCVVTEIKKIAGQVVSTRTYPDPGCKEEEKKPALPEPPFDPENGIELEDGSEEVYCVLRWSYSRTDFAYDAFGNLRSTSLSNSKHNTIVLDIPENVLRPGRIPFSVADSFTIVGEQFAANGRELSPGVTSRGASVRAVGGGIPKNVASMTALPSAGILYTSTYGYQWQPITYTTNGVPSGNNGFSPGATQIPNVIFGTKTKCKAYARSQSVQNAGFWGSVNNKCIIIKVIPLGEQAKPKPFLPTGNRPPMNQNCCKEILANLADLKEVLAAEEMLRGECTFPWRLRMPGGEGEEKIEDYPNLIRALSQQIDHLGLHPARLLIKDINNAQEGNQSIDIQYPSGTQAFEALMRQVWDANADGDTLTNMIYRLSWLCIQQSYMMNKMAADIQVLKDNAGVKTELTEVKFPLPFNIAAGTKEESTKGKGFGKDKSSKKEKQSRSSIPAIDNRIDLNTEKDTEALLPDFMKCRENPVMIERLADGEKDTNTMLNLILMKLESLSTR